MDIERERRDEAATGEEAGEASHGAGLQRFISGDDVGFKGWDDDMGFKGALIAALE